MIFLAGNKSRQGVSIHPKEMQLLYELYRHEWWTYTSIFKFVQATKPKTDTSLRRRLLKLEDYKVIAKKKFDLGIDGFKANYYRVGSEGVRLLYQEGFITERELTNYSYRHFKLKQLDHFLSTQELVVHGVATAISNDVKYIDRNPKYFHYEYETGEGTGRLVPDWLIETPERRIHIELDTGSESFDILVDKMEAYKKLASKEPSVTFTILVSVLDKTYRSQNYYGDRTKRVGGLKQTLLRKSLMEQDNLEIIIVPFYRSFSLLESLVLPQKWCKREQYPNEVDILTQAMEQDKYEWGMFFRYLPDEELYFGDIPSEGRGDRAFALVNGAGDVTEHVIGLHMQEGHLRDLYRLDAITGLIHDARYRVSVSKVFVSYQNKEAMLNDVLGDVYAEAMFFDRAKLESDSTRRLTGHISTSLFHKKEVSV